MKTFLGMTIVCIFSSCNLLEQTPRTPLNNSATNNNGTTSSSNNGTTTAETNNRTTSTNNDSTPTIGTTSATTTGTTGVYIPFSSLLTTQRSTEGLIAQWHFDTFDDKVGNLLLHTHSSAGLILPHGVELTGGFVDVAAGSNVELTRALKENNAFTIELWLNPDQVLQDNAGVVSLYGDGTNFSLSQDDDTVVVKLRTDDASLFYNRDDGEEALIIPDGFRSRLSHFVWTYDGVHTEIWIDGTSRGTMAIPGGLSTWEEDFDFALGTGPDSNNWAGKFLYASIYNRSLRPEEIKHHFALRSDVDPEIPRITEGVQVQRCVAWPFDLISVEDFQLFSEAGCTSVDGDVRIPREILNLDLLTSLERIGGDLIIQNVPLSTLDGLNALTKVDGRVLIMNNMNLEDLSGLNMLSELGSDLRVSDNSLLESFDLALVNAVPGHFILKTNVSMNSASGLDHLKTVGGSLVLDDLPVLPAVSLSALESVGTISFSRTPFTEISMPLLQNAGGIWLRQMSAFTTFNSPVTPDHFHIFRNPSLTNLEGFHGTAATSVHVAYNNGLTRLGMDATELNRIIIVENNLSTLDLRSLTTITEEFDLTSSMVTNLDGALPELLTAGAVVLWRNEFLTSMDGAFPKLTRTLSLGIRYSDVLLGVSNAFLALQTVNWYEIADNTLLPQCDVDLLVDRLVNPPNGNVTNNNGINNCP